MGNFLFCPVVRAPHFHCGGKGLIPGQGTKILHATWNGQKQKTKKPPKVHIEHFFNGSLAILVSTSKDQEYTSQSS